MILEPLEGNLGNGVADVPHDGVASCLETTEDGWGGDSMFGLGWGIISDKGRVTFEVTASGRTHDGGV